MKKLCLALFAIYFATAVRSAGGDLLTPEPDRMTDEAIAADLETLDALQERLAELNAEGVPLASYHFAKAQAWLDFARDEYTENDRSRVVEEALGQAVDLIERMEEGENDLPMVTPMIPSSAMVRPDLWEKAEGLKQHPLFRCAGDKVAQLEVQLVWAGHENRELGWRHANPYLQAAERLATDAETRIAECPPLPAAAPAPVAVPCMPPPAGYLASTPAQASMACADSAQPAEIEEKPPLPDRVHFAFNSAAISKESATVLDVVAAAMKAEPSLHVTLRGHADQRGDSSYNLKLSRLRAQHVRTYLTDAGISADRIVIAAFGKARPLNRDTNVEGYARNRRVEFLYTVEDSQRLQHQDEDLQPEPAAAQEK